MKRISAVCISIVVSTLFSTISFAAGFRLPEQASSAMGMASAFVGQADDPSAVWYNPAGITQLEGSRVSGGLIGISPDMKHENTNGTMDVSERKTHYPVHMYATRRMTDNFTFGFGINNPFGLSTRWDANSATRYVATYSFIRSMEFNPNIAIKVNDDFSFAVGAAYIKVSATLEKILTPPTPGTPNFKLSGDGDGWGANAAMLYKVSEKMNLGLSYRSKITVGLDGTAVIESGPLAQSNPGETSITLPELIQAGVSYKASDKLTMNADIDYTMWSSYDKVVVQSNTLAFTGSTTSTEEKHWKDVWCLRIGGQYKLTEQWKLRAGYLYDKNPVGETHFETRTPDSDRQGLSVGTGYTNGNITVDAAYLFVLFKNRTITNSQADDATATPTALNGTYKSQAHMAGITVGYKF